MFPTTTMTNRYHLRAMRLPEGNHLEDWWVVDGRLSREPVADAIELPGRYILPGLVDAHTHLSMDFNQTQQPAGSAPLPAGSGALIAANLATHLAKGVTVVRDAGRLPNTALGEPQMRRPPVIAAGYLLAPAARFHAGIYNPVAPNDLIATALAEVEQGIQWVKIIADFPGPDWNWFNPIVNYAPELVCKLVKEVHAAGARVMAHVSGPFVAELIRAGVDSIEHGTLMTPELAVALADQGASWTPTFATVTQYIEPLAALPNTTGEAVRQVFAQWRAALPLAERLGVPILAGTDEVGHGALDKEIAQLHRFGLSVEGALAAASTTARTFFDLPALRVGACADFVTYLDDPRGNLDLLNFPAAVMAEGRLVKLEQG